MTTVEVLLVARSVLKEYSCSLCVVFVNVVRNRTFSSFGWKLQINLAKKNAFLIKIIQKQSYGLPLLWYWLCLLHERYKLAPETPGRASSSWCCTEIFIIVLAVILQHLLWYLCNQICDPKDKMVFQYPVAIFSSSYLHPFLSSFSFIFPLQWMAIGFIVICINGEGMNEIAWDIGIAQRVRGTFV